MLVTIKAISEELKEDGSPKHIEWEAVGADGKETKPKIYPAIQVNEQWIHFEDRWDEFKNAKDKTYDIERASIKIGQRTWMPIIKAVEVKDVFRQEAVREVQAMAQDDRQTSIEGQVALKELGELIRSNIPLLDLGHQKLVDLYFLKLYDLMNRFVYGGEDEPQKQSTQKDKPDKEAEISQEISIGEAGQTPIKQPTNVKELMEWAISQGKPPSWVCQQLGVSKPSEIADIEKAYEALKEKIGKE